MGGMFTGVADDITTTYWNTAGLSQIDHIQVNLLHLSYFADTFYEFAGVSLPLGPGSTLGLSASFDFVPSFNSTNDPLAIPGSASDLAVAAGYGQVLGEILSIGVGGKFISSQLMSSSALGVALDAGFLLYTPEKDWTLGLSIQNLGQISNFSNYASQEKLPTIYRAGLAYRYRPKEDTRFLVGLDLEKPIDGELIVRGGGELWVGISDVSVAFRAGYALNPLNQGLGDLVGGSLGAGVLFSGFELNYALVPFGALGDTQRFSLTYHFGVGGDGMEKAAKPVAVEIQPEIADLQAGTVKSATFDLKPQARTDIQDWVLEIKDPQGNLIRTIKGQGVPPRQITWNGRDESGNVVPRGLFANYTFRTVDGKGQQVSSTEPIYKLSQVAGRQVPLTASLSPPGLPPAPTLPVNLQPVGVAGLLKLPSVQFAWSSDRLSPDYLRYLDQVARLIRKYPAARVYIEGHSSGEGREREQLILSQNRADSVMRYLVEMGKVSPDNLYSRGHGETVPLLNSDSDVAKSRNRRVDILIFTK
jgi:outer membrane protein OmpA-like peptidoglycan-associated protein